MRRLQGAPHVMSDSNDKPDHLLAHRTYLAELAERTQSELDKTLITLSSAALGVTLIVLKDFTKPGTPVQGQAFLTMGWILLLLCLGFSLLSYAFSRRLTDAEIASVDRMIRCHTEPPADFRTRRRLSTATAWANRLSMATFFLGAVLTLLFASANL